MKCCETLKTTTTRTTYTTTYTQTTFTWWWWENENDDWMIRLFTHQNRWHELVCARWRRAARKKNPRSIYLQFDFTPVWNILRFWNHKNKTNQLLCNITRQEKYNFHSKGVNTFHRKGFVFFAFFWNVQSLSNPPPPIAELIAKLFWCGGFHTSLTPTNFYSSTIKRQTKGNQKSEITK